MTWWTFDDSFDDDRHVPSCPRCGASCTVEQPEEPDVGINGATYACPEHGEWFEGDAGPVFPHEEPPRRETGGP